MTERITYCTNDTYTTVCLWILFLFFFCFFFCNLGVLLLKENNGFTVKHMFYICLPILSLLVGRVTLLFCMWVCIVQEIQLTFYFRHKLLSKSSKNPHVTQNFTGLDLAANCGMREGHKLSGYLVLIIKLEITFLMDDECKYNPDRNGEFHIMKVKSSSFNLL